MTFKEYSNYDGVGLAALVRNKEVSPLELVEAAIDRVERHNGAINAVVYKAYDEARRVSANPLPDGPFKGVPFLVKDLGPTVEGWPRTSGSRYLANAKVVDTKDSGLIKRYRESGVVLLGKTNLPEFGIMGTTESALFGPCRNPWSPDRIAGGSSGGSAAAVAAGIVPMAQGGDGQGSIRIPAACCGLVGLKVTRERNPDLPNGDPQGNVVDHVLTRTVRDCATMLDVTGRAAPASPFAAPAKARPYAEELERDPACLRIAWSGESPFGQPIAPEVNAALEETVGLLQALGHVVVNAPIEADLPGLYAAAGPLAGASRAAGMKRLVAQIGREPEPDELEPLTWTLMNRGVGVSGADALFSAQERRLRVLSVLEFFEAWDVFLCPALGTLPSLIGYLLPDGLTEEEFYRRNNEIFCFPWLFNFTGQPSISLPLAQSTMGLPVGMMFSARYADEATLFRLAAQLERAHPWAGRKPPIWN